MQPAQRFSKKREAILEILRSTDSHPSADWVYQQMRLRYPDISLGTVYRNLAQFKEQGTILCVGTVRGVERFDANVHPHVHFVCQGCDSVTDLHRLTIPEELCGVAARESGGAVDSCWMTFYGKCDRCSRSEK